MNEQTLAAVKTCTYAEAVREALQLAMRRDASVFLMGEDIGLYGGSFGVLEGLLQEFGAERVRDTPISEAGFTGAAVGAALVGMKPVVEIMFSDFLTVAMDQIVNQAAKFSYMFGGQSGIPLVIRTPSGSGMGAGAQHSQSLEALFAHIPGLKVVVPSSPAAAKGLLLSAIEDPDPVLFFEQKRLYKLEGDVPGGYYTIPLGKAAVSAVGTDVSIVTYGAMVQAALQVRESMLQQGISIEVIDVQTLVPLDRETLKNSVKKTGRVVVLHEAVKTGGFGAEITAMLLEDPGVFSSLRKPPVRVCGKDVPIPFSRILEEAAIPSLSEIEAAVLQLVGGQKLDSN